jgi:hypothetical protein
VTGPYVVLGAVVDPTGPDGTGENGHGTAVLDHGVVHLVYQERRGDGLPWRFMRATVDPAAVARAVSTAWPRGTSAAVEQPADAGDWVFCPTNN